MALGLYNRKLGLDRNKKKKPSRSAPFKMKLGKISNMAWLAYNATPWQIAGYGDLGPGPKMVSSARRIMNALGPDVNKMKISELNEMLAVMTRTSPITTTRGIGYRHLVKQPDSDPYMKRYYEEKYLLPAEAGLKGFTGRQARSELKKRSEYRRKWGGGWLGF